MDSVPGMDEVKPAEVFDNDKDKLEVLDGRVGS